MHKEAALILFGCFTTPRYPEFIHSLKRRGLTVLGVDEPMPAAKHLLQLRSEDPDHFLWQLDEIFLAGTAAYDEIMQKVATWKTSYAIRGVYCIKETFVEAAGLVADYLDTPSPGLRAARVCRSKHLQRLYLSEWAPTWHCVLPANRQQIGESFDTFPTVLKPVGRVSSSGVQLIQDRATLSTALPSYPDHEALLLEQRVYGAEYSVESMVQHGRTLFTSVTAKGTNEEVTRFFVELAHTAPAANLSPAFTRNLLAANQMILERLAFQDGIAHGEYRVTADGRVYLMEIAARNPGDGIMPLYLLATGQLFEEAAIAIALGEEVTYPQPTRYARQVYLGHRPGRLIDVVVSGEGVPLPTPYWFVEKGVRPPLMAGRPDDPPTVREINVLKRHGDLLGDVTDSFGRSVWVLMDARTPAELDHLEAEVRHRISVLSEA